jgi:hypothetical protein
MPQQHASQSPSGRRGSTSNTDGSEDTRTVGAWSAAGNSPVSLISLQGRAITLDEILSSLDNVKHWEAAEDANRDVSPTRTQRSAGRSSVGHSSFVTLASKATRASIHMQRSVDIRRAAARAAAVYEEKGTIAEETGAAARAAAAAEAVSRAAQRATAYERARSPRPSPRSVASLTRSRVPARRLSLSLEEEDAASERGLRRSRRSPITDVALERSLINEQYPTLQRRQSMDPRLP